VFEIDAGKGVGVPAFAAVAQAPGADDPLFPHFFSSSTNGDFLPFEVVADVAN
jgi:hypothetical protein